MLHQLRTISSKIKPSMKHILTDVSLITGSHGSAIDRFHNVISNHSPNYIDTGKRNIGDNAPVNAGLMYPYVQDFLKNRCHSLSGIYTMDPKDPAKYSMISYRTSISAIYQEKTENITIKETKAKLASLAKVPYSYKKLYVSCLNECPYTGPIDLDLALREICHYYHIYNFDEISLCDTCASLSTEDFSYLIVSLVVFGIPKSKIAIQLSLNEHSKYNICFARNYGIYKWDVVADDYGGLRQVLTYNMIRKWI